MDWLLHNPLAEMYGPNFLALYAAVIAGTLGICYARAHEDDTDALPPPPLPIAPDPYEIAFLRGGENEVVRLAIFRLLQRGSLRTSGDKVKTITCAALPFDRDTTTLEHEVLAYFNYPRKVTEIFTSPLPARVRSLCAPYEERLRFACLLNGPDVQERGRRVRNQGALVIFVLGGYKLMAALHNGYDNVGFLVAMGMIAVALLAFVCQTPRLSSTRATVSGPPAKRVRRSQGAACRQPTGTTRRLPLCWRSSAWARWPPRNMPSFTRCSSRRQAQPALAGAVEEAGAAAEVGVEVAEVAAAVGAAADIDLYSVS